MEAQQYGPAVGFQPLEGFPFVPRLIASYRTKSQPTSGEGVSWVEIPMMIAGKATLKKSDQVPPALTPWHLPLGRSEGGKGGCENGQVFMFVPFFPFHCINQFVCST